MSAPATTDAESQRVPIRSNALFGNLFRDRDGDLGIGIEAKNCPLGEPWIKLKYKNGRTSWMPAHYLKEIEMIKKCEKCGRELPEDSRVYSCTAGSGCADYFIPNSQAQENQNENE